MIDIQGPDGQAYQFPDGTPRDEMRAAMQKRYGGTQQGDTVNTAAKGPFDPIGPVQATLRGVGQGATAGFGDEIKAFLDLPASSVFNPSSIPDAYSRNLAQERQKLAASQEQHPYLTGAGEIGGALLTAPLMPEMAAASIPAKMVAGAKAGAVYGGLYGFGSGEGTADRMAGALTGAVSGGAGGFLAPGVANAVQAGVRGAGRAVAGPVRAMLNPDAAAARRVAQALEADQRVPQQMLGPADEATALQHGQPVMNIDRGGEATRQLALKAGNLSPTARGEMNSALQDRFQNQGGRAMDAVRRIVGGNTTTATRDTLESQARLQNRGAYNQAYRDGSEGLWSPELERLTSSPAVVDAMRAAATRGKDRAVAEGFGGFNPGVKVTPDGRVMFRQGRSGVPTYPDLQYWDYVQRELSDTTNAARRTGRNEEAAAATGLGRQLRQELDNLVPSFGAARAGAAASFGAQNALEAGDQFVMSRMANDEARQALGKMKPAERQLFSEGFADSLVRRIGETSDRQNVINSVFIRSRASKERIEMALGPQKAKELEAFLRTEDLIDRARNTFGGSTTARQASDLAAFGGPALFGGSGMTYGAYTGDWNTAGAIMSLALFRAGTKAGRRMIDRRVADSIGKMLVSQDPAIHQRALKTIASNQKLMDALRSVDIPASLAAAQGATEQVRQLRQPADAMAH